MTKTINVVCAIIEHDGRFLAARRGDSQPHAGSWEFPGGKIAPGESPQQAVVREIREELGTDIAIQRRLPQITFDYPDKTVNLIPFVCTPVFGDAKPLEHAEIRWMDKSNATLRALAWLPPDAEILKNYLLNLAVVVDIP